MSTRTFLPSPIASNHSSALKRAFQQQGFSDLAIVSKNVRTSRTKKLTAMMKKDFPSTRFNVMSNSRDMLCGITSWTTGIELKVFRRGCTKSWVAAVFLASLPFRFSKRNTSGPPCARCGVACQGSRAADKMQNVFWGLMVAVLCWKCCRLPEFVYSRGAVITFPITSSMGRVFFTTNQIWLEIGSGSLMSDRTTLFARITRPHN